MLFSFSHSTITTNTASSAYWYLLVAYTVKTITKTISCAWVYKLRDDDACSVAYAYITTLTTQGTVGPK